MRDEVSLDEITMLASASKSPIKDRLIAASRGRSDRLRVLRTFAASAAIDTYRVRLKLWQDDVLTPITGLPGEEVVMPVSANSPPDFWLSP